MTSRFIGVVVIGRNEGERLRRCLASVVGAGTIVIYVDSGSVDDSVAVAKSFGVKVVELDMSIAFTAARARNEGFAQLDKNIKYVQFVDGDCEVVEGWLMEASAFLDAHAEIAVVSGRRRERFPERSVYNLLCDVEWDAQAGVTKACGGDALMRADSFSAVGGYRADLIAGEEPELCVRLRAAGWKIWRVCNEMTLHDAGISRFGQWWKRTMRGGFAFAEGAYIHGASSERHRVRESVRIWFWGGVIPILCIVATVTSGVSGLLFLLVYPLQVVRLAFKRDVRQRKSWLVAFFMMMGKFPEMQGQLEFIARKLISGKSSLIEYK